MDKEKLLVVDLEVYPNYTLFAFKSVGSRKSVCIEIKGEDSTLDDEQMKKLRTLMMTRVTFGFNSQNYDLPIILFAMKGKTVSQICQLSNHIIGTNSPGWKTMKDFGISQPKTIQHFDICEPSPGVRVSLKLYGGRMHSKRLQDLPIQPNSILTSEEMEETRVYCINDLDTTIDLFLKIEPRIDLRVDMSKEYGQDLMSKSDAQIAEVVIKSELSRKQPGKKLTAPKISSKTTFKYSVPKFIRFQSSQTKEALEIIRNHNFELSSNGSIKLPVVLSKMKITLGWSTYQLGIGGIHSTEKKQTIVPNENQILADKDVASYYPAIILNLKLFPRHLGETFLDIYQDIVNRRLKAKKEGNKVVNESLKIVINGSFGKLGSKWSALYSPDLMMTVTLTGQLALLMLIERLELSGISVVSANTDGFVSLIEKDQYEAYCSICSEWEKETNFSLEETQYKALYSRDVNNYLAVTAQKTKGKGIFTLDELSKNPQAPICVIAVMELLHKQIPIRRTIRECGDVTKFLSVRTVNGGAVYRGKYLGRVVRWIYSTEGTQINYKKNGNKVPKSDGSRPIMELPEELPKDLDYERYISEACDILDDIGLIEI